MMRVRSYLVKKWRNSLLSDPHLLPQLLLAAVIYFLCLAFWLMFSEMFLR